MVKISQLSLITDVIQFTKADKILFIDFLRFSIDSEFIEDIKQERQCILFESMIYVPIILTGSPKRLFTLGIAGFPYHITSRLRTIARFDGKVSKAIEAKKIYGFTNDFKWTKGISNIIDFENDFMVETYFNKQYPLQLRQFITYQNLINGSTEK